MGLKQAQRTVNIVTDAEAEIACIRGEVEALCGYLRQPRRAATDVVRSIAYALMATATPHLGPGNWKLILSTRAGGRPQKVHVHPADAIQALATGQALIAAQYLLARPELDRATQLALADAFDPDPVATSKWKLTFKHARNGYPQTELKTAIHQAIIKITAEHVKAEAKKRGSESNWEVIYPQVQRALEKHGFKGLKASAATIRAAITAAREGQGTKQRRKPKNPPL